MELKNSEIAKFKEKGNRDRNIVYVDKTQGKSRIIEFWGNGREIPV